MGVCFVLEVKGQLLPGAPTQTKAKAKAKAKPAREPDTVSPKRLVQDNIR